MATSVFFANEREVTFITYSFENEFDTKSEKERFTVSGLVSHRGGLNISTKAPSDSAHSSNLRAYFRTDSRISSLPVSATAIIDGLDYSVVDVDCRNQAPGPYSIAVALERVTP